MRSLFFHGKRRILRGNHEARLGAQRGRRWPVRPHGQAALCLGFCLSPEIPAAGPEPVSPAHLFACVCSLLFGDLLARDFGGLQVTGVACLKPGRAVVLRWPLLTPCS